MAKEGKAEEEEGEEEAATTTTEELSKWQCNSSKTTPERITEF